MICLWVRIAVAEESRLSNSGETIKIGVLALRGEEKAAAMWKPTADYLSSFINGYRFTIVPLNNDSMIQAVRNKAVDFVLSNPASYAGLEKQFGVTRLVTLKNRRIGGVYTHFGALIFTRRDRDDINSLGDLKGKAFMAVHPNAFGGWWMALREFKRHGLDPKKDFAAVQFSGFPQDKIVYAVKSGRVDAGTVRTDLLEHMHKEGKIDMKDFKVLNPRPLTKDFPFMHSTDLYPEWAFAKTNSASGYLARRVTIALLSMPEDHAAAVAAKSAGWTVPMDYQPVHDLMMELNVGPYEHLGEFNFVDVIKKYEPWITAVAIGVLCMVVFVVIVIRLNTQLSLSKKSLERSKAELEQQIADRQRAELAEKTQAQRIRALYEISAIPGLSFDEQIERTIKLGCRMFNLEIGKLCRIDVENNSNELVKVIAPEHLPIKAGIKFDLPNTFCSVTFDRDEPLAIHHISQSSYKDHPCYQFTGLEAYIGTPIWVNGKKFGTINFSSVNATAPFTEADKDLINLIGRWVSVTFERYYAVEETRQAREDAELANRAKSAFLANLSHELRTPLNAVIGYSELLQEELQEHDDPQLVGDAMKIKSAGKNLLALINDVLDLSKIEAGKVEVRVDRIELSSLVDEIHTTIAPLARKGNNDFHCHVEKDIAFFESDHIRLRQILINLLGNACKFTDNGKIVLSVWPENRDDTQWVYFQVSDTGQGIAAAEIDKLFQEFNQAGRFEDKNKGTGLGLAISRKLSRLLGGDISLKSAAGVGSTFTVKLPARQFAKAAKTNNKGCAA